MVSVDQSNTACGVFESITGAEPGTVLRFVVGEDTTPHELSDADISDELSDAFANLLLHERPFPATADELLAGIDARVAPKDSLGRDGQQSFVLGEGSQLPIGPGEIESSRRTIRFLVTRGTDGHGPELIISAFHPQEGLVEVMAWDTERQGFNFYRNIDGGSRWVFAGNSAHALSAPTQGKGPFESHPTGNLLMKELKLPWVHWDSFKVHISEGAFAEDDVRREHPWFKAKKGAEDCEVGVVMPSIERWTSARFDQAIDENGNVRDPARVVEQMLTNATVNLTSSTRESGPLSAGQPIDLPPTFFVDADGLALVGLPAPPRLEVSRQIYAASLTSFAFKLNDHAGFEQPGDTHFAFVVPERAFEDIVTVKQAMARGLITERLVAALIMVDFPNPVFSAKRASLLGLAPATATITTGASTFSDDMAQQIVDAAPATAEGSAEREFAELWAAGDDWRAQFGAVLTSYYAQIQTRLSSQDGFDDYTRLAESRRNQVRKMPIFEFKLLLAETNVPRSARLMMQRDGTVQAVA